jgi:hypothetical protein
VADAHQGEDRQGASAARAFRHPTAVLEEVSTQPQVIIRELVAIGGAVLPGENCQKLVFANISDVHDYVAEHYTGYLQEQRRAGKRSVELCKLLVQAIVAQGGIVPSTEKDVPPRSEEAQPNRIVAPKPRQIRKALFLPGFVRLESEYAPSLRRKAVCPQRRR